MLTSQSHTGFFPIIDDFNLTTENIAHIGKGDGDHKVEDSQIIMYLAIGCVGILGNGLTLIILCSSATIRNKTFNMFLISQSILDLLCAVMLIATAWDIVNELGGGHFGIKGILRCYLWDSKHQLWMILLCSTGNLVALNIERWLSILYPVYHKTSFTKKHVGMMITGACLFGLLFNLARMIPTTRITSEGVCVQHLVWPSQFWFRFATVIVSIVYLFFPFLFILTLYLSIFLHLRKMASQNPLSEGQSKHMNTMDKARTNVLKTLVLLSSCFFLCWSWNITLYLLFTLGVPLSFDTPFYNFSVFMVNINCCINPFCYAVQYREFQEKARSLFCNCKVLSHKRGITTMENSQVQTVTSNVE